MKKIIISILTITLLLSLVACGGSAPEVTQQPEEPPVVSDDTQTENDTPVVPEDKPMEQEKEEEPVVEETPVVEEPVVEETPSPTPEVEPEPVPEVTPTPVPEQPVEPTPVPAPEVIPEPTPTPEQTVTPEVEPESTPTTEESAEPPTQVAGTSWVEGQPHDREQIKVGATVIKKDGTKVVLEEKFGVIGFGQGVDYITGVRNSQGTDVYKEGIASWFDHTPFRVSDLTGECYSVSQWNHLVRELYPTGLKGDYDGEVYNVYYKWDANWFGPGNGKWVWQGEG